MRPNLLLLALHLLTLVSGQPVYDEDWVNVFQQGFNFQCPHGEMLVAVRSYFSAAEGSDRLWVFQCRPPPMTWESPLMTSTVPAWNGSPCAPKMPWLLGFSSTAADMAANVPIPLRVGFRVLTDTPVIFLMVQRHSAAMCLRTDACFWHRRTSDVPEYYGGEGDMTVPVYGYFIRGAQTTFNGVFRDRQWKYIVCRMTDVDCEFENF